MKAARRVVRAASILFASAVALSCNNAYGIFQNVQGEQKQTGTSVFQEVSVSKAFRLGNNYYAALGSLQTTPVGQDSWSKVAMASLRRTTIPCATPSSSAIRTPAG